MRRRKQIAVSFAYYKGPERRKKKEERRRKKKERKGKKRKPLKAGQAEFANQKMHKGASEPFQSVRCSHHKKDQRSLWKVAHKSGVKKK